MSAGLVSFRNGDHGWQLILADLALILFLVVLSTLPAAEAETGRQHADRAARGEETRPKTRSELAAPAIAAAQALYRPTPRGPSLGAWLAGQPRDPRATLTVFARHRPGGEAAAWQAAQALAVEARGKGVAVRVIIAAGDEADLYASLAYDEVL